jgi:hypothetical protein
MAVSTVDRKVTKRGHFGGLGHAPVKAATIIPHGRAVFIDAATGLATNTSNSGANQFVGIAHERIDNSAGANGDLDCEYWIRDRFELVGSGFAQTSVGKKAYLADNGDGLTLTSTDAALVGTITEYISATLVEVDIDTQTA